MMVLGPVPAQPSDSGHAGYSGHTGTAVSLSSAASAKDPSWGRAGQNCLERSPRHGEYVDLKIEGSDQPSPDLGGLS